MRFISALFIVLLTTACTPVYVTRLEAPTPTPTPTPAPHGDSTASPQLSIAQLLIARQTLCQLDLPERDARLSAYRAVFVEHTRDEQSLQTLTHEDLSTETHRLDARMLATCEPALTPGILSEMLGVVTEVQAWPEAYMALFDLLVAERRSYAILESKYRELRAQHEETIRGIQHIEAQIDQVDQDDF